MQEFFHDLMKERLLTSENPVETSDLLLSGHVTGCDRHFENSNSTRHKCRL